MHPMIAVNYWERKQRLPYGAGARIAKRLGVQRSLVSGVMRDGRKSRRVARALARAMNLPIDVAFPELAKHSADSRAA